MTDFQGYDQSQIRLLSFGFDSSSILLCSQVLKFWIRPLYPQLLIALFGRTKVLKEAPV
jgi:hypothetical protein